MNARAKKELGQFASELSGERIAVRSESSTIGALATRDGDTVTLLVYCASEQADPSPATIAK